MLSDNTALSQKHYFAPIPSIETIPSMEFDFLELPFTDYWKGNSYSALTAYCMSTTEYFWLIDGDDTLFHHSVDWIRERIKKVESIVNDYDGLSLDFYRHTDHIEQWSLGVACLKQVHWSKFQTVTEKEILELNPHQKSLNIDAIMDTLRRQKKLRLESFCFEDSHFTHCKHMSYHWKNRKLWNIPLKEDIIVL